jgi:hypothetical protein
MPWRKQFVKNSHVVFNFPHLPNHKQIYKKLKKLSSFAFVVPQPWSLYVSFSTFTIIQELMTKFNTCIQGLTLAWSK